MEGAQHHGVGLRLLQFHQSHKQNTSGTRAERREKFDHLYKAVNGAVPLYYFKITMSEERSYVVDDLKRYILSLEALASASF